MQIGTEYACICSQDQEVIFGDREVSMFTLPPNLCRSEKDTELVVTVDL